MRCATKNGTTQNWIESNNLRVWIREGEGGLTSRHQTTGRVRVFATVGLKYEQGIIRCPAGVGGQGSLVAMESPKAVIAPLKRGSGGLIVERGVSGFGTEPQ